MTVVPYRFIVLVLILIVSACSDEKGRDARPGNEIRGKVAQLTVYKTPACEGCQDWINHVLNKGFNVDVVQQKSIKHIKALYGLSVNMPHASLYVPSCHIAVSDDNFVFEGRVPVAYIARFLSELPEGAVGLSVSAMPLDSSGTELGYSMKRHSDFAEGHLGLESEALFKPYQILQLQKNGSARVFAKIYHYQQQFN